MKIFFSTFFCIYFIVGPIEFVKLNKEQVKSLQKRTFISVVTSKGKKIGAGADINSRPLYINFEYFKFFPLTKEIEVKGRACSFISGSDTVFLKDINIFKSQNRNDTLFNVESLKGENNEAKKRLRIGEFYFRTKVDSSKLLYFVGPYTRVFEYDIPQILSMSFSCLGMF